MSILTNSALKIALKNNEIIIQDLIEENISINSIDLRLGENMAYLGTNSTYQDFRFNDTKKHAVLHNTELLNSDQLKKLGIDENEKCFLLLPNKLYIAHTIESIRSDKYHFQLHNKSTSKRWSISTHQDAGFGDLGFEGQITLEIQVVEPTIVYVGQNIVQVAFSTVEGEINLLYGDRESSKYHKQSGVQGAKLEK